MGYLLFSDGTPIRYPVHRLTDSGLNVGRHADLRTVSGEVPGAIGNLQHDGFSDVGNVIHDNKELKG